MRDFEIILGLLLVATLVEPLARRFDVPLAIAQVVCGLGLSAIPFVRDVHLDPELTFTLFVPPLLFWSATTSSLRDVRQMARPIIMYATVLILISGAAVAAVAHSLAPELTWPSAFVLGAIVAPPDADVTTSIARRLGVPRRVVTVLEGETLLNDTMAFVAYRMAVRATVMGGMFSLADATRRFAVIGAIGLGTGLIFGWLVVNFTKLKSSAVADTTFSLIVAFAAYVSAERLGGSGVLAVVTAGFCLSRFGPRALSAETRINARSTWEAVTFCVGSIVFTLIGVQIGRLAPTLWSSDSLGLIRMAALVSATVIAVRLVWVFLVAYVPRFLRPSFRARDPYPTWRRLTVVAWAGLRGGDTLVMVLAVPYTTDSGAPFPGRETVVAVAIGVIVVTLVVQGLTLRPLIKRLGIPHDDIVEDEERRARIEAARAALDRLTFLAKRDHLPDAAVGYVRANIEQRTRLDLDDIEHAGSHDGRTTEDIVIALEYDVRNAARQAVVQLRDDNVIGQEALRRVQNDLDLEEIRGAEVITGKPRNRAPR